MKWLKDHHERHIRLTSERENHIINDHPEMYGQLSKIQHTLLKPDNVVVSRTDLHVELFYRHYYDTHVGEKYLCVVVKTIQNETFIITAYFTDRIKKGKIIWKKK